MLTVYFWLFSLIAVLCGFSLLTARHPISAAVSLIGVMLAISGIYGLLDAPFLGIAQILVYAGAIMMLVVFVIMVLNSAKDRTTPRGSSYSWIGLPLGALMSIVIIAGVGRSAEALTADPDAVQGTAQNIGRSLFTFSGDAATGWYVLFEVVGLVLLAAMVGAVVLAKRSLSSIEADEPAEGAH
ncbi:MAG: NADH-quinone oxidoreductase subunit J [Planctomycetota bacterium]|jgi:NADH-quinone oxidoreductase subunit J|nr:NADH-quinone oxidoreductase subunit J [Planctomycetota bacterium]